MKPLFFNDRQFSPGRSSGRQFVTRLCTRADAQVRLPALVPKDVALRIADWTGEIPSFQSTVSMTSNAGALRRLITFLRQEQMTSSTHDFSTNYLAWPALCARAGEHRVSAKPAACVRSSEKRPQSLTDCHRLRNRSCTQELADQGERLKDCSGLQRS